MSFKQYSSTTDLEIQDLLQKNRQTKTQKRVGTDREVGITAASVEDVATTRHYRLAKTKVNTVCATYPTYPANTFPIIFGEYEYDPFGGCGCITRTWRENPEESEHRLCHDIYDNYYPAETILKVFLHHGRWYFDHPPHLRAYATLTEDLCGTTGAVGVENFKVLPFCWAIEPPPTVKNPHGYRGADGMTVKLTRKKCTTEVCTGDEWEIDGIDLQAYCAVVGIEDRTSCLVAAGLRLAGMWCPNDEPITACVVVEYTDCDTTLPPCDPIWSFAPEYACCGQFQQAGGGGGGPAPIQPDSGTGPGIPIPGLPGIP